MRRLFPLALVGVVVMVNCAAASAGQQTAQPEQQWRATNGTQTLTAIHVYSPDAFTLGFVVTESGLKPGQSAEFAWSPSRSRTITVPVQEERSSTVAPSGRVRSLQPV